MAQVICRLNEIPDPGGFGFQYWQNGMEREGFVLVWHGQTRAYTNSCPHTGVTLSWSENQFFDLSQQHIQCSLHGALFQPLDGLCIRGPCLGQKLVPLETRLVEGQVVLVQGE